MTIKLASLGMAVGGGIYFELGANVYHDGRWYPSFEYDASMRTGPYDGDAVECAGLKLEHELDCNEGYAKISYVVAAYRAKFAGRDYAETLAAEWFFDRGV